jgi:glycosyltransferase involved in cell wall biosynthesis
MKILMVNKFFYQRGGSEAYMLDLSDLLKKQGHQVIEFSMEDEKNEPSQYSQYFVANIDFAKQEGILKDIKKALQAIFSFEAQAKLEQLIIKEKPDIAHLHNFSFQLTPSVIIALKKHKIPIIWTLHDYKLICPNFRLFTKGKVCERCKKHKYYNGFFYKCLNDSWAMSLVAMLEMYWHKFFLKSYDKVDLFISPSKFLAQKIKDWGISPNKIKQVYNFIDYQKMNQEIELGKGLLYFGRLTAEKGIMTLVKAMAKLPEMQLKIIGDGPQKNEIKNFIRDKRLKNIELIGHQKSQQLYEYVKRARVVIVPSIWYENNPIAILEAFALPNRLLALI